MHAGYIMNQTVAQSSVLDILMYIIFTTKSATTSVILSECQEFLRGAQFLSIRYRHFLLNCQFLMPLMARGELGRLLSILLSVGYNW
jgi:hypothetical protein